MQDTKPPRIAFFVSSHGFGHAARACAVMQSLRRLRPDSGLRVYTETPAWFFRDSVGAVDYRPLRTDIGLVQRSPMLEDIPVTLEQLAAFLPFRPALVNELARQIADQDVVMCDISPLGLVVAAAAGVPSVLLENFTWDWIYRAYLDEHPGRRPMSMPWRQSTTVPTSTYRPHRSAVRLIPSEKLARFMSRSAGPALHKRAPFPGTWGRPLGRFRTNGFDP